jgi:hypothetical protein
MNIMVAHHNHALLHGLFFITCFFILYTNQRVHFIQRSSATWLCYVALYAQCSTVSLALGPQLRFKISCCKQRNVSSPKARTSRRTNNGCHGKQRATALNSQGIHTLDTKRQFKERDNLEDLGVNWRVILKRSLKKQEGKA